MSVFTDFISLLGVPHTAGHSDKAFASMPFKSLFGFSRLLRSYGVESEGVRLPDKKLIARLPLPLLAQLRNCFVIVTALRRNPDSGTVVEFLRFGRPESLPMEEFLKKSTGVALIARKGPGAAEPDYASHRFFELVNEAKLWILAACTLLLLVCGFITAGLWRGLSTILLTAVNFAGIAVTWLLILKTLKIKSKSADRICGVLQEHGCDHVLEQKASTFFGIFSWSEVGITYFTVSTLILFLYPGELHNLALINGCCLPFTLWSIWYQKFRIRTWCTLCVTTQCLLWLQFFCYLFGGWWEGAFPMRLSLVTDVALYAAVLMAVNRLMNFIKQRNFS